MNLVFIIKNRDETPFMVVRTTPNGSTFEPMSDSAKDIAKMLRQEYGKTPITKPELVQTMDASKIIEGPSPSGTATQKKVANISIVGKELQTLPVLSISEVLLSEFSNEEFKNVLTFKASSFISDQTRSSAHFEIKGVRAIWDPSLSIPGTNRRGGFRCPVGTRYGGQITDRFGRSCGWGVARRIANQIADIGERLEQRDDDKRKRRLDRRNARMIRRLGGVAETGRVEGGLRNFAERLEGGKPQQRGNLLERVNNEGLAGVINRRVNRGRRQDETTPEVDAPSARVPRNRRRDVIPETAPTPTPKPQARVIRIPPRLPRPPRGTNREQQRGNVDVLTARDASDAGETEDFKPYVLRKYNEYAKRVREIRAGGGNAGMLTRREWYAINKENLRDAWKDAHGRSAPQDFEPPTPQARRPRNNRGRRRQATAQGAGRAATRRPTPNDVPEPAPARPVRPARPARPPRRSPSGGGAPKVDKDAPTTDFEHSGVAYRNFASARDKARQLARLENQDFHVIQYVGNGHSNGPTKLYVLDNAQYEALKKNEALKADGNPKWSEVGLIPKPTNTNNEGNPENRSKRESGVLKVGEILGREFNLNLPYEQKFDANPPNIPPQGVNRRGQIVWNPDVIRAFNQAELKIDQSNLKDTHMAIYLQNNVYIVRKIDAKNIEDAWRNNSQRGNALGYRDINATSFPEPNVGKTPKTPPAPQGQKKSPFRKFARSNNAHGKLNIDRKNSPIGKFVSEEDRTINTQQKAIDHIKNGGDIQKVPAKFMHLAIEANSSRDARDTNKRFRQITPNGGAVGVTKIYYLRNANGIPTNQGWVFKAAKPADNVGELIGWNYLAAVGILEDGAIQDGKLEADVRKPLGTVRKGTPYIMIPLAHNDVPEGAVIGRAAGAYDFNKGALNGLPDKGFPERLSNVLANYILGVSDRHEGNGMGRVVEAPNGQKLAHVVPLDLGWAGKAHGGEFERYQRGFFMDSDLIGKMRVDLQNMPVAERRETYARIQEVYRQVIVQTEKTLAVNREQFIQDALQKISKTDSNKARAGAIYDGMTRSLRSLRNSEDLIVNLLPQNMR